MTVDQAEIDKFKSQQAIYECLLRFARGLDRRDPELMKSAYHPDATHEYGSFSGTGWEFVDWVGPYYESMGVRQQTSRADNVLIEFKGRDSAVVQSSNLVFLDCERPDGLEGTITRYVGGRYLDRVERRDGVWKIAHRQYVLDWNRNEPSTANWQGSYFADLALGRMDDQDDSYELIPRAL